MWLSGIKSAGWLVSFDPDNNKTVWIETEGYNNIMKPEHIEWIEQTFVGEYLIKPPQLWPAKSWDKGNIDGMVFAFPIIIALPIDVTSFILRYGDKILKS